MRSCVRVLFGLGSAFLVTLVVACGSPVKAPPMPEVPNPPPAAGASALEVERYQLIEQKRALSQNYGANIDRIKQINNRLIEINLELRRQGNRP